MTVTESFVWINYPKSGSTFARKAFRRLYDVRRWNLPKKWLMRGRWMREVMCPELRLKTGVPRRGEPTPHGTVSQIPEAFRHLPVYSSLRDPFERLISNYEYGDWKKPDIWPAPLERMRGRFPEFPELSFDQFTVFLDLYFGGLRLEIGSEVHSLDCLTTDLLLFFLREPVDPEGTVSFPSWDALRQALSGVRLLSVARLNQELYQLLRKSGHHPALVHFILREPKVNVSPRSQAEYFSERGRAAYKERAWLLFACLEELSGRRAFPS